MIDDEESAIHARAKRALRAYREARGWSGREMADFLGVPVKSYEKYEGRADRGVPVSVIARLCRYTDSSLDWIMFGKKPSG